MGAIKKVSQHKDHHAQNQFLSNLFLVSKKDEVYRPAINLKILNQFVPYQPCPQSNFKKIALALHDFAGNFYLI